MTEKIKYPYLPDSRTIKYVDENNEFMKIAKQLAEQSNEQNHPTGAVVVKNGKIIGKDSNHAGFKNKTLQKLHNEKGLCVRKFIKAKSGTKYWACPGCAPFSSHAEQTAIKDAIKNGENPAGADLYLYGHWWCCEPCWQAMLKAEIKKVYLLKNSENLFDRDNPENIIHTQFQK